MARPFQFRLLTMFRLTAAAAVLCLVATWGRREFSTEELLGLSFFFWHPGIIIWSIVAFGFLMSGSSEARRGTALEHLLMAVGMGLILFAVAMVIGALMPFPPVRLETWEFPSLALSLHLLLACLLALFLALTARNT